MTDAPVERLLRATPILPAQSTAADGRRLMARTGVPALAVVDEDGTFVGLFGEREWLRSLAVASDGAGTVGECLSVLPAAVGAESSLMDIAAALVRHRAPAVALLDGPIYTGIITAADMVRMLERAETSSSSPFVERVRIFVGILTFVAAAALIVALSV
jgi:CBS domain-containing protein